MSTPLNVTIIGAGIAGLSAGLSLQRKGHNVRVFEANPELAEFGAGIQLTPNATRILCHYWGLERAFRDGNWAHLPFASLMRRYDTGEVIGKLANEQPEMMWLYGSPYWQMYRPDLQKVLYEAATASGVKVDFGKKLTKVDSESATVYFADGTSATGDLVIGADGIWSKTRPFVSAENDGIGPVPFKEHTYRVMVPCVDMLKHELLAPLVRSGNSDAWLGPGSFVLGYTVGQNDALYNLAIPFQRSSDAPLASWNEPGDVNEMRESVKNYCPTVRALTELVDGCAKWTLGELPILPKWHSENGKVILVGDAAHAFTPHAAQGAAMAIEDAAVLGEYLSTIQSPSNLPRVAEKFQNIRERRIQQVRGITKGNADMLVLPDGPEQQARDARFKQVMEQMEKEKGDLAQGVIKQRVRPDPDPNAHTITTPGARMWLYGADVVEEVKQAIAAQ